MFHNRLQICARGRVRVPPAARGGTTSASSVQHACRTESGVLLLCTDPTHMHLTQMTCSGVITTSAAIAANCSSAPARARATEF